MADEQDPQVTLETLPVLLPSATENGEDEACHRFEHSPAEAQLDQPVDMVVATAPAPRSPAFPSLIALQKHALPKVRAQRARRNLLDLPNDILEIIIKDITHTNDLCAVSLTCSALHSFAVPHIYSRFDIVWPDSTAHVDPKSGVDALTYGLSTLVMAEELFGEAPHQRQQPIQCEACGHLNLPSPTALAPRPSLELSASPLAAFSRKRRRYGNHYAQYCRKFSLGNGPKEWVQDYMISREAGKLLGTQVALAVARMRNLESFVWDMPTGILREVWMSLASLDDRADGKPCKLERVWIRWHNNDQLMQDAEFQEDGHAAENNQAGPHPSAGSAPFAAASPSASLPTTAVFPGFAESFSILPPLKSLSVLDIDVANYLHEMAVLIGRSRHSLRELRIGIASHVVLSTLTEDLAFRVQSGNTTGVQGKGNIGGVLGALFAHVFGITSDGILRDPANQDAAFGKAVTRQTLGSEVEQAHSPPGRSGNVENASVGRAVMLENDSKPVQEAPLTPNHLPVTPVTSTTDLPRDVEVAGQCTLPVRSHPSHASPQNTDDRLPLEVLELERVPLSVFTLREALDWSKLTDITLLDCANHENFWRSLRRQFAKSSTRPHSWHTHTPSFSSASSSKSPHTNLKPQSQSLYRLQLRKIHVNAVSPCLMAFLRDALAPNTLQTLFLHASSNTDSMYNSGGRRSVSLGLIYRGPVRRHARSLVRLSIDSGLRSPAPDVRSSAALAPSRKSWTLTREVLAFLTSGKLRALREMAVCLDHRDWHFFLQRLPALCHLRSLYIPQILDRITGRPMEVLSSSGILHLSGAREFAQQVLDIVVLRPEVQLCYLGMFDKCFEILEGRAAAKAGTNRVGLGESDGEDEDEQEGSDADDDADDDDDTNDDHETDDTAQGPLLAAPHAPQHDATTDEDEDEDDAETGPEVDDDDEEDEDEEEDEHHSGESDEEEDDDVDDEDMPDFADGDDGMRGTGECIRLREILFYDDKVAVFRARLGRL